ncbi:hypothetical protein [Mesorhizobium australicum]|uniref:Uncharacterized protein n=1 Tax=Mesorhizobium australicum TaxID=536018 RepID=A0A1X7NKI5_9HYPH|nr:hypothetical protein [Mesorhizobium australicum]SMH38340.1 hypothetical protein SAMN02982922_2039 [Mesorhizobium australicum]
MNREWHEAHPLPRNATFEERLEWHRQHREQCGCRESPANILKELEKRGLLGPRASRKSG